MGDSLGRTGTGAVRVQRYWQPYTGVAMSGYEYQRFQTGTQPFWAPLGLPGQYHDAETDSFQN
jgi:hypothetical protein